MASNNPTRAGPTPPGAGFSFEPFHLVLVAPEIPNNTGTIGRTCVALGCPLHLIEPIGFDLDEKAVRRAGLDYWRRLDVRVHASWDAYTRATPGAQRWLFSARAERLVYDANLRPGDHLVFGSESAGLPPPMLAGDPARCVRFPMLAGERSINLACIATAGLYEGIRRAIACGAS